MIVLCALLLGAVGFPEYAPPPSSYSLTKVADTTTARIWHDAGHLVVDQHTAKGKDQPVDVHIRIVVDLATMQATTWDVNDAKLPCSTQDGKGLDPFDASNANPNEGDGPPKQVGKEAVHGIPSTVFERSSAEGTTRIWRDDKYGLVTRVVMTPKGDKPVKLFEVTQFTVTKIAPAVFAIPARCRK